MSKPARPLRVIEVLTVVALIAIAIALLIPRCQHPTDSVTTDRSAVPSP